MYGSVESVNAAIYRSRAFPPRTNPAAPGENVNVGESSEAGFQGEIRTAFRAGRAAPCSPPGPLQGLFPPPFLQLLRGSPCPHLCPKECSPPALELGNSSGSGATGSPGAE